MALVRELQLSAAARVWRRLELQELALQRSELQQSELQQLEPQERPPQPSPEQPEQKVEKEPKAWQERL
jgi:hypothetical protein